MKATATHFRILLAGLLLCSGLSFAQQFKAGFTIGLDAAEINGAHTLPSSRKFGKLGVTGGFLVNTKVGKKSILQLEMNFTQKGSQQRGDSLGNGAYSMEFAYIEIPVVYRHQLYFTKRGVPVNRFDLEMGASVGRLIEHHLRNAANTLFSGYDQYYNYTDVSLLLGVTCNITPRMMFSIRYSNSVIPVIKRNTPYVHFLTYTFNRGNNEVIQFALKFVFKGKAADTTPKVDATVPQDQ